MAGDLMEVVWAFLWGIAAASGLLVGALLGLRTRLSHRTIAAVMSLGAGLVLSVALFQIAFETLLLAGAVSTAVGIVAGATTFSAANAALTTARDRKRCGECKAQPTESEVPGSGESIALGTTLDAMPESLVLGSSIQAGGPDLTLVVALAFSNLPEALSSTAGMRLASRSQRYVVSLWIAIVLASAAVTALSFHFLSELSPGTLAILKAYGTGALLAMAVETMIPEAFHNGPRYSGVLAATGFASLTLVGELAR